MTAAWHEIKLACPYCSRTATVLAHDIRGELRALRCVECGKPYLVEIFVQVTHAVRAVADQPSREPEPLECSKPFCPNTAKDGSEYCEEHQPKPRKRNGTRSIEGTRY